MTSHSVGVTLGKYAPLHKGHQSIIDLARKETDEVHVIIYDTDRDVPPLPVRAQWIKDLYPDVIVHEAWGGPKEEGYTPEIKRAHEKYLEDILGDTHMTHFYSSEPYGEHVSQAFGAIDRRVDEARTTIPTSGTLVRSDPFVHKSDVDPRVYRDLVANVVLMGGPSTGKTTLATALAKAYNTVWMPEYGREYWATHQVDRRLTPEQLLEIAEGHIEREEKALLDANRFLITDTNAITTLLFARYYHGKALPQLEALAEKCASRYDLFIVCDAGIPFDDTEDRSGDANRQLLQRQTLAYLDSHRIPYVRVHGSVEERMEQLKPYLDHIRPYRSPFVYRDAAA